MKKPPCADWHVWVGPEVEGSVDLGKRTLFVRHCRYWKQYVDASIGRVWFCCEFDDWNQVREAIAEFPGSVCLEVNSRTVERIPKDVMKNVRAYYKLDPGLKPGDFVCVGPAFSDEAFQLGSGRTVRPENYLADRRLA